MESDENFHYRIRETRIRETRIKMYEHHIKALNENIETIKKWIEQTYDEMRILNREDITEEMFHEYLFNRDMKELNIQK